MAWSGKMTVSVKMGRMYKEEAVTTYVTIWLSWRMFLTSTLHTVPKVLFPATNWTVKYAECHFLIWNFFQELSCVYSESLQKVVYVTILFTLYSK